jgi:phytoene dehydrogenase-like protein
VGKKYDAIVIGAGHNGLTNAAYLAKSGLKVLMLERNAYIGGATVSRELHKDWIYSNCSYVCSLLRPEIYRSLNLAKYGLQVVPYGGSVTLASNGDFLGGYWDSDVKRREMARHSPRDAVAYSRFSRDIMRQCRLIRPFLMRTPADPTSFRPRDVFELIHMLKQAHGMGEKLLCDTIRFHTLSIADYLDEYFENGLIKAAFAGSGIIGTALGVMSPGTAYVLLHHAMGDVDGNAGAWGFARGGMGSIAAAMAGCFRDHGGEILTDAGVRQIIVKNGRAVGVALENGDDYYADTVVSNLDVKRTFLELVEETDLVPKFVDQVRNFKIRGSSGKLNIALDGQPEFPALGKGNPLASGDMHIVDSIERLERAYDDWKRGSWSRDPYVDILIPTLTDPTMAPPGKHYMSVFVQYAPFKIKGRDWTDQDRQAFGQTVIDKISQYSPNFKDLILHAEVRTPQDMQAEVGLTEGNIFQGELSTDQLFFNRPIPGYAQYRAPIRGMYLCGSTTHPGGGVMAAPGANAAREILRDLKQPNSVPESWPDD